MAIADCTDYTLAFSHSFNRTTLSRYGLNPNAKAAIAATCAPTPTTIMEYPIFASSPKT